MGICYIVGASEFFPRDFFPNAEDFVIAADGGYLALQAIGVMPDLLLGDFDSLGEPENLPAGLKIERHPVHKDDTDTGLALMEGFSRGYRDFSLYGCSGGRVDHLLANIQSVCRLSRQGATLRLIGADYDLYTLTNGTLTLPPREKGTLVSVFCHGETACGVTLRALMYPLTDATLTCDMPLGVSNQVLDKNIPAEVTVTNGTVFIVVYTSTKE